jgi:hypothetical protein
MPQRQVDSATSPPSASTMRFIVGMSRAGTTWLSKCLNEQPDAAVFGETAYWGRGFVPPRADGSYGPEELRRVRQWLKTATWIIGLVGQGPGMLRRLTLQNLPDFIDQVMDDVQPPVTPAELYRLLCERVGRFEGKPIVIEKTPHHVNWIDRITAALPESRFVVMVRDPYSFMLSYKHQGDRKAEPVRQKYRLRIHPFGCAMVWRTFMRAAQAAVKRHPDRTLLVRFEDITRDPAGQLARVQTFLGLERAAVTDRIPPDNTSFPQGHRPELTDADLFWMRALAGRDVRACGQALRRPRFGWPVLWSILTAPVWAVRNAIDMRRIIAGPSWRYLWRWLFPPRA